MLLLASMEDDIFINNQTAHLKKTDSTRTLSNSTGHVSRGNVKLSLKKTIDKNCNGSLGNTINNKVEI